MTEIYPEPKTYEQSTIESLLNSCKVALKECDALRDENEKLQRWYDEQKAIADALGQTAAKVSADNKQLRLEQETLMRDLATASQEDHALRAENERLERMMKAHRETAVAAIAGAEKQLTEAHTENELLRIAEQRRREEVETAMARVVELEAENERLQGLVDQWYEIANRLQGVETEIERLRAAVLAYDDLIRVSAQRGQRVIDDDPRLDQLYEAMIRAAGRDFDGWQP